MKALEYLFAVALLLLASSQPKALCQYQSNSLFIPNTADLSSQTSEFFNNQAFGLINLLNTNNNVPQISQALNSSLNLQGIQNDFKQFIDSGKSILNFKQDLIGSTSMPNMINPTVGAVNPTTGSNPHETGSSQSLQEEIKQAFDNKKELVDQMNGFNAVMDKDKITRLQDFSAEQKGFLADKNLYVDSYKSLLEALKTTTHRANSTNDSTITNNESIITQKDINEMEDRFNEAYVRQDTGNDFHFYLYFAIMSIVVTLLTILSIVTCMRCARKLSKRKKLDANKGETLVMDEIVVEDSLSVNEKKTTEKVDSHSTIQNDPTDKSSEITNQENKEISPDSEDKKEKDPQESVVMQPQCSRCSDQSHRIRSSQSSIDSLNTEKKKSPTMRSQSPSPSCSSCSVLNNKQKLQRQNDLLMTQTSSRTGNSRLPVLLRRDSLKRSIVVPKVSHQRYCKTHGLHEVSGK